MTEPKPPKRETARQKRIRLLRKTRDERWIPRTEGRLGGGCALCREYGGWGCCGCPIWRDGHWGCKGTLFDLWDDVSACGDYPRRKAAKAAAVEEVAYLNSLIRKEGARP